MKSYTFNDRNQKEYVYTEIIALETSCKACGKQATYAYEINGEHVGFYCSICVGVLERGLHSQFSDELALRGVNRGSIVFANTLPPTKEELDRLAKAEADRRAKDPLFKPALRHAEPVMPLATGPNADLANKKIAEENKARDAREANELASRRAAEERRAKEALARDNATRGVK